MARGKAENINLAKKIRELGLQILEAFVAKKESVKEGRRLTKWTFFDAKTPLVERMMAKIEARAQTSFRIRLTYSFWLKNVFRDEVMKHYKKEQISHLLSSLKETQDWLAFKE